jgi:hypothetical protein
MLVLVSGFGLHRYGISSGVTISYTLRKIDNLGGGREINVRW